MAKKELSLPKFKINWQHAAGEIAIVSIGIILAFQLNTWKTNRTDRILEKESLQLLYNEVLQDSAILYQYFKQANLRKADATSILQIINTPNPAELIDSLSSSYRRCGFYSGNVLHRSAFAMMTAQGTINLVRNEPLKNAIYKYYDRTHKVVEIWNDFEKELVDNVVPQLYAKGVIDDARVLETNGLKVFYKPDLFIEQLQLPENRGRIAVYMRAQNELINVTNFNRRGNKQVLDLLRGYLGEL